ncbi:DNA polymerase III subunit alpha [Salinibacillus aidingensis]|uniref:DNA polymerase III subunit alpha n=1 Tax=Salinibacillus aidingensis TaxID=237684 RepID=A0ABN1AVA1_9BACI
MDIIHLEVHSGYSFMNSLLSIDKLVKAAKGKGFAAVALTDDHILHGAVQFYERCRNEGIKPIIGMKTDIFSEGTLYETVVLAKSTEGYKNLIHLSSELSRQEQKSISMEDYQHYADELITILPSNQPAFNHLLFAEQYDEWALIVKSFSNSLPVSSFFIGVRPHQTIDERQMNRVLKNICDQNHQAVVALQDVRYEQSEDYIAFDCLQSMKAGKKWSPQTEQFSKQRKHMMTSEEMMMVFEEEWPEALDNMKVIADQCEVDIASGQTLLPHYPTPDGRTSEEYLRKLCYDRIPDKYGENYEDVQHRLEHELSIIERMKFSDYFLIVWDFIQFARSQQIMVGPGRGSAAGSLVAYLLDITQVDPIHYGLLFERFLNPERRNMPDIDVDFSDHRRDEVIQYVQEKYGSHRVAQIITFGTFGPRSLLRELIKTMGIDEQDAAFLIKHIPQQASSLAKALKEAPELTEYVKQSDTLKRLFKIAHKIEGLPRHHSTHAAGVVLSDRNLTEMVPILSEDNKVALTQYPMGDLEHIGLLKMDFLGLRNLSLMEQIINRIRKGENRSFTLEQIPLQDSETFTLLQSGQTSGIFQLESSGMRNVLQELKPTEFEDVVAVNALYRPGPMDFISTFIKRKHGKEKVTYPHEDLKPILEKTYGVLVYQEQIMQIAHRAAGYSLGEADLLRRAVSKKKRDILASEREKFIDGCLKNGYSQDIAEEIYQWIVAFANYGFNRSHAVAYSLISYQLAYLKAHYPSYFFASILSSVSFDQDKVQQYIREAKNFSIQILPPSVNRSYAGFSVEGKDRIRMALTVIKGVGKQAVDAILDARKNEKFQSLFDFCQRVPLRVLNRSVIEALVLAGAFDETGKQRSTLLASLDQAMEQGELFGGMTGQESFFEDGLLVEPSYTETEPFPMLKQLSLEKEVLGMYVSSHPLNTYRELLRAQGMVPISRLKEFQAGKRMKGVAAVQSLKVIRTKRGDQMAFATFGDETDEMEAVIFPNVYREINPWLQEEMLIYIEGKIDTRNHQLQWIVEKAAPFDPDLLKTEKADQRIYIQFKDEDERKQLNFLLQVANEFPGQIPILVYSSRKKETYRLTSQYRLNPSSPCLKKLKNFFGYSSVVLKR